MALSTTSLFVVPSTAVTCSVSVTTSTAAKCAREAASKVAAATAAGAACALLVLSPIASMPTSAAVLTAPECVQGEGPGCAANAEENELVGKLLEKSRANREKNDRELLEKYWKQGYGDYFSFGFNKDLIKGEDGKWRLQDPDDPFTAAAKQIQDMVNKDKK